MADLVGATTMCELIAQNPEGGMGTPAPSLGLIKPVDVEVDIAEGDPWSDSEQAKVARASAPDLVGTAMKPLEPAPFAIKYQYRCESPKCNGHKQKVLDWEAGQAGRDWKRDHGEAKRPRRCSTELARHDARRRTRRALLRRAIRPCTAGPSQSSASGGRSSRTPCSRRF